MFKIPEVPNDTRKDVQSIKDKYKILLDKAAAISIDNNSNITDTLAQVNTILSENNEIDIAGSKNLGDQAALNMLDIKVLKKGHELVDNALQTSHTDFNEDEYADKLLTIMGPEMDWDKLSPYFMKGARIFNGIQSMAGTFKLESSVANATQKKERCKRDKAETAKQQRPLCEKLQSKPDKAIPFINLIMNIVAKILNDNGNVPIPYYKMVCDPHSFPNTMDNIFQLSFLFNTEKICFGLGEDSLPTVCLVRAEMNKTGDFIKNHQFVSSMNPPMWQKMIALYDIKVPLMNIDRDAYYNGQQSSF